jgi:hypothetical protein
MTRHPELGLHRRPLRPMRLGTEPDWTSRLRTAIPNFDPGLLSENLTSPG